MCPRKGCVFFSTHRLRFPSVRSRLWSGDKDKVDPEKIRTITFDLNLRDWKPTKFCVDYHPAFREENYGSKVTAGWSWKNGPKSGSKSDPKSGILGGRRKSEVWHRVGKLQKIKNSNFSEMSQKVTKWWGNDQKRACDHHLGVRTIKFGDLGCPGRYAGWESDENPRCGIESENDKNVFFYFFWNFSESLQMIGYDKKSAIWAHLEVISPKGKLKIQKTHKSFAWGWLGNLKSILW